MSKGSSSAGNRDMLSAALQYATNGFKVFPVRPDKKPLTRHGLKDATRSEAAIRKFWKRWPDAGIGLDTSGLVVLDVDKKGRGDKSKAEIEAKYGPIPKTRTHRTGGGGLHYLFRAPIGTNIRNSTNLGGYSGVDLRANGGYIVVPPSQHHSGDKYEILNDDQIAAAPDWLLDLATRRVHPPTRAMASDHPILEGCRNDHLARMAGSMRRAGFSQCSIEAALLRENTERCQPPLEEQEVCGIARSIAQYEPVSTSNRDGARHSTATQIIEVAKEKGIELFHTPDRVPYAVVDRDGHQEVWLLESRSFKDHLAHISYNETGSAPSSQAIQSALNVLRGDALYSGREERVYTRLAEHRGSIYLDLCDPAWRAIEVSPRGWRIIDQCPVRFARTGASSRLPDPEPHGDFKDLRSLLNIDEAGWLLLAGYLVGSMRPSGPFPIQILNGEQGSAKSTVARIQRSLIDPSTIPLRSLPRDERDLAISASNSWLLVYDNISSLSPWQSDAFCRLSTGGGFATRELYTNNQEVLFTATRPILLNGIGDIVTRSDLLDRAIIINLPVIPDDRRRTEAELWEKYEPIRPQILGVLLDAISLGLRDYGSVQLDRTPRMADFARWVVAAIPALGISASNFLDAYYANVESVNELALESSPAARAILTLASELPDGGEWTGTATQLLDELGDAAGDTAQRRRDWPKSARALSAILSRLAPNLRVIGVDINRDRGSGERLIYIRKGKKTCVSFSFKNRKRCTVTRVDGGLRIRMRV